MQKKWLDYLKILKNHFFIKNNNTFDEKFASIVFAESFALVTLRYLEYGISPPSVQSYPTFPIFQPNGKKHRTRSLKSELR